MRIITPGMVVIDESIERPLYTLNVSLDYAGGTLNVQQRIEFQNPSGTPLNEAKFNVPPARHIGLFKLNDVRVFGQSQPLPFTLDKTVLTVRFPASLQPNDNISIAFDFRLKLPAQEGVQGIGGDDTSQGANSLIAGHWYVMLAPYRDGTWDTPAYYAVGDPYTSELADYEVSILAPDNVIVAGAGEEKREGRLWRYTLTQGRVFAFAASPNYKVETSEVNGVRFATYSYARHEKFGEDVLITAERAVKLFSRVFGAYPYRTLRIVENDRGQGQEYSGLVSLGSRLYDGYSGSGARHDLISWTAHEVSHQWWFQTVGNDQVRAAWLDETFARYSEYRFYQEYYPADVDWWLNYYIKSRNPNGAIDLPLSGYADGKTYVAAVYQRGVLFILDLRKTMGETAFDEALRDYYAVQSFKISTPDAFFDALARHTSVDLSAVVKTYFATPPALPCKISNNAANCRRS